MFVNEETKREPLNWYTITLDIVL